MSSSFRIVPWTAVPKGLEQVPNNLHCTIRHLQVYKMLWGWTQAVLVGTDIPDLSTSILHQALEALDQYEVIVFPMKCVILAIALGVLSRMGLEAG
jgi:Uncharacterized protein conserved in bacteria (DUF2064)